MNTNANNKLRIGITKIEKLILLVMKNQNLKTNNLKVKGSFYWGKTSYGKLLKHPNSWVTFFCIQALMMYENYTMNKKNSFDSFDLV